MICFSFDKSWHDVAVTEILMNISHVSHFESLEEHIEVVLAVEVWKFVSDEKVHEDCVCLCSNSVDCTALINCSDWLKGLSCSMSDYFLCCCVMLSPWISICVCDCSSVMSSFIVIALSVEVEVANSTSNLFIVFLEVFSTLNIWEIFSELIAATSDDEVKEIPSSDDSEHCSYGNFLVKIED